MHNETAHYLPDLPIGIRFLNISEYPHSWRDSIQILYVLKGELRVQVENESYVLKENYVDIINAGEVFEWRAETENEVLVLDIDPSFFERFYDDAKEVFFYTDEIDQQGEEDENYRRLRKFLAILVYESMKRFDDYEEKIEECLLQLMYHLLNHFHYLYYEGEIPTWDPDNFNRSHRIVKYISNNYMNKVSLQDLAEQEFLTSQYLSFKIKDTFGQTFNDYLNRIRVDESTKLLLNTDKPVAEIAEDVGFSHVRYYNKHFKLNYGMTPVQYRKKHKLSERTFRARHKYQSIPLEEALPSLRRYIEDYERFEYDDRIFKIEVDLEREPEKNYQRPEYIGMGEAYLLLEAENRRLLSELQSEMNLKYIILRNVFSEDMDVYRNQNRKFINWTRIENLLEFIDEIELTPLILKEEIAEDILESFVEYFEDLYPDIRDWLIDGLDRFGFHAPDASVQSFYDRIEFAPYVVYSYVEREKNLLFEMVDEVSKDIVLYNDTFFGGTGLFTSNNLKKPSYYALFLLTLLGEEVLQQGEGYIVTRSDLGFQILFYNPFDFDDERLGEAFNDRNVRERRFSLNLKNMASDYQVTKYVLNRSSGSVYDKWLGLNSPERLDDDKWQLLKEYVHPNVDFYYMKKCPIYNIFTTVPPYGVVLYVLTEYDGE